MRKKVSQVKPATPVPPARPLAAFDPLWAWVAQHRGALICYGLAVLITLFFWAPLVNAKWGLIDDHEVMWFVGPQQHMPIERIPEILAQTELGRDSTSERSRPVYYSLRMAEAVVWGRHAGLWYGFRVAIAVFLALTLARFALHFAGPVLGSVFVVFVLASRYWADIFARAGPSEGYAVLGCCLLAWCLAGVRRGELSGWRAVGVALGVVIAGGAKENLLFVGLVPLWVLLSPRVVRTSAGVKALMIAALGFLAWVAWVLLGRLRHSGTDVYANDVSVGARARLLESFFAWPVVMGWCVFALLVLGVWWWASARAPAHADGQTPSLVRAARVQLGLQLGLLALFAGQYIFYGGNWPSSPSRYQFPGMLMLHVAILGACVFVVDLMRFLKCDAHKVSIMQAVFVGGFVLVTLWQFTHNAKAVESTVRSTHAIDQRYEVLVTYLKAHPGEPLVINSHSFWDHEPISSLERFTRASGLDNPLAVQVNGYGNMRFPDGSLPKKLAADLVQLSREGRPPRFIPLAQADTRKCFSVGLNGPFLASCEGGVYMWP